MTHVYYANGKKVELREYLEVMLAANGNYKQDVVLIDGGTVHVLIAKFPGTIKAVPTPINGG